MYLLYQKTTLSGMVFLVFFILKLIKNVLRVFHQYSNNHGHDTLLHLHNRNVDNCLQYFHYHKIMVFL